MNEALFLLKRVRARLHPYEGAPPTLTGRAGSERENLKKKENKNLYV